VDKCAYIQRKSPVAPKKGIQKPKPRKATGELAMFKEIYDERPKVCELCGKKIHEFNHSNFHHIKPKGKYPELRLVKINIQFICFTCHYNIHNN
jgi:hypothetical protein